MEGRPFGVSAEAFRVVRNTPEGIPSLNKKFITEKEAIARLSEQPAIYFVFFAVLGLKIVLDNGEKVDIISAKWEIVGRRGKKWAF